MKISYCDAINGKSTFHLNKKVVFVLLSVLLMTMTTVSSTAYAGGDKGNSCSKKGIEDGKDHPFSQGTYEKCGDNYYNKFKEGCMSVEGNDRDTCESATDG